MLGAVLLGTALVGLQLMLDRGEHNDWFDATETVIELLIAACAFWVFGVHSWFVKHPLFKGEMVWNANFFGGLLFMVILGITNVGLSAVLPTMYQNIYGYDVMSTGILMAPRGCGVLITMIITNRIMARVDNRLLITLGYGICAGSLWIMTTWSLDMDWHMIALAAFVQGLGLGFVFVPVNMVAFSTLPTQFRTDGATLMTLFRNLGSSFGIAAIVTLLGRNIQTSHADIAANVTSYNVPAIDLSGTAAQLGSYGDAALAMLNGEVTRQAAMVAYLDNFYMLFWVVLAIAPLAYLLKRPTMPTGEQPVLSE
jgi:DHA2 family multidrug resistance protein